MLDCFGSSSSISCQFLALESPFIQVIFIKKHIKNPLFEGLYYNLKGLELFSKTYFESSWVSEGLIEYVFFANLLVWFFVPPPLRLIGLRGGGDTRHSTLYHITFFYHSIGNFLVPITGLKILKKLSIAFFVWAKCIFWI